MSTKLPYTFVIQILIPDTENRRISLSGSQFWVSTPGSHMFRRFGRRYMLGITSVTLKKKAAGSSGQSENLIHDSKTQNTKNTTPNLNSHHQILSLHTLIY